MKTSTAGEWFGRLDIIETLEADGWIGDDDMPLSIVRKNGCTFAITNDCYDSGLSGPGGWGIDFPSDVPSAVIVAACQTASGEEA